MSVPETTVSRTPLALASASKPAHHRRRQCSEVDRHEHEVERTLVGARQRPKIGGRPLEPVHLAEDGREHLVVRGDDPVEHPLGVAPDGGQRRSQLVSHVAHQLDAPSLGVVERAGQRVHVGGERCDLELDRWGDVPVVAAGGEAAGRGAHLADGTQDASGDPRGDHRRRDEAGQQGDNEGAVERTDKRIVQGRAAAHGTAGVPGADPS